MKRIFVLPTDTLFGIFAQLNDNQNKNRIFLLKTREKTKPLAIYINNIYDIKKFCDLDTWENNKHLFKCILPGPFTFILKTEKKIPFVTKKEKIGIRYTENDFLNKFISNSGILCGTSFNISGQSSIYKIDSETKLPIDDKDLFIYEGECKYKKDSLILEQIKKNKFIIRRKNDYFLNILEDKLKKINIKIKNNTIISK